MPAALHSRSHRSITGSGAAIRRSRDAWNARRPHRLDRATLDAKLATARRLIEELAQAVDAVTQKLQMLDALRVGGDVEAAHLTDAERFRVLFAQIRSEVDGAAADLRHLAGLADHAAAASAGRRLDRLADRTLRHAA